MDQDECWFSRFAQPRLHSWAAKGEELRLVERQPKPREPDKALACFGAVRQDTGGRFLFFSNGQPDTEGIILMLERLLAVARREKKRVLVIVWDRASWHKSQNLRQWLRQYNRTTKRDGDVRLLTCLLPVKSPWLNPMEAHWLHAKRAIAEPDGELSVAELKKRLCAHFQVELETATLQ
jgi:transposase